ncbi:MAG: exodeoxyribonuclease VII small subunit [Magnetococcales bacterium]|nr:exodeoxyribonuclease VII small subunit [Magnetococcales bacterium]
MQSIDFERSLARLESIVQQLERGDLPLEQSLGTFEEGIQLVQQCQQRLDEAEQRIETLVVTVQNDPNRAPGCDQDHD